MQGLHATAGHCTSQHAASSADPAPTACRPPPLLLQYREACRAIAQQHGCMPRADGQQQSPFTVIIPSKLINAMLLEGGGLGLGTSSSNSSSSSEPEAGSSSAEEEAEEAAAAAAAGAAAAGGAPVSSAVAEMLAELRGKEAIWQQPPAIEYFTADRATAKALAKELAEQLRQLAASDAAP